MPGEARIRGKLPGRDPAWVYAFVKRSLEREGSRFVEERPPEFIRATQGKGRLTRTFAVSIDPVASGTHLSIRVTSPEDWTVHVRAGARRVAIGVAVSGLGLQAIAFLLANNIGDVPLIAAILLFSAGAPIIVGGWARWQHARMLVRGQATALWLP